MELSTHAQERIQYRLNGIITEGEVKGAVSGRDFKKGETWLRVKKLPKTIFLPDGVHGDVIYVIVRRATRYDDGVIATVELREHSQKIKGEYLVKLV